MKLHKIKINNIASLKGAHEVDFDSTLLEQGSFAITGDTGAGKSTILNCVSLALYGRSYKGLNQGDFVTLGESSGKVELTFSCGGSLYLSIWGCRVRKKNGEFLKVPSHTKEFYKVNDGKKEILDIAPEDIIHLNFDQFCKTVILNQGEFAKFLTSSFRERKDILEKLYQGEKLDVFNPLLRERINKFSAKADASKARMKGLGEHLQDEINPEGLKGLEAQTEDEQRVLKLIETRTSALKDLHENDKALKLTNGRILDITQKIDYHVRSLNSFLKDKANFDKERDLFVQTQKDRSPALHQALEWEKRIKKLADESDKLGLTLKENEALVEKSKKNLYEHEKTLKLLNQKKSMLEKSQDFRELNESQVYEAGKELEALNKALNKIDHLEEFGAHISETLKSSDKKRASTEEGLNKLNEQLKPLDPLELERELAQLERLSLNFQGLEIGLESYQEESLKAKKELANLDQDLEETRKRLGKTQEKYDLETETLDAQRKLIKQAQSAHARFLCLRESIERDKCVLCDNDDIGPIHGQYKEAQKEDFSQAQKSIERLEKEHENTFKELQRERSAHSAAIAQADQLKEKQKNAFAGLLSKHLETLNTLGQNGPRANVEKLQSELNESKDKLDIKKSKLKKEVQEESDLRAQKEHLEKTLIELKEEIEKLRPQYERTQKEHKGQKAVSEEKLLFLSKLLNKESAQKIENCLKVAQDALKLASQIKIEMKEGELIAERLKNAQKTLSEVKTALEQNREEVLVLKKKVLDTCGDQSPEEAIKEMEKEAHVFELKRKTMERDLKDLEIEKSALFSRRQTFEEQRKDQENMGLKLWGEKRSELNGEHFKSDALKGLLSSFNKSESAPYGEELELAFSLSEKEQAQAKELLEVSKGKLSEYRAVLKRQESAKEQIKKLGEEIADLEAKKSSWEELYLLIGKDEFRNYVLAMVEKLLIQQTNAELSKLCDGRYLIQHKASSSRLAPDFYIIDKFRGDETRKVSTLSGGETFMVSLAMALALAELTRGNADIDSFFIDEGFGTLDRDSLEEALEMLQDIETRGKQIGLISHVKELTNRIPVNIHLQKNRLGNSSIDIVYN